MGAWCLGSFAQLLADASHGAVGLVGPLAQLLAPWTGAPPSTRSTQSWRRLLQQTVNAVNRPEYMSSFMSQLHETSDQLLHDERSLQMSLRADRQRVPSTVKVSRQKRQPRTQRFDKTLAASETVHAVIMKCNVVPS